MVGEVDLARSLSVGGALAEGLVGRSLVDWKFGGSASLVGVQSRLPWSPFLMGVTNGPPGLPPLLGGLTSPRWFPLWWGGVSPSCSWSQAWEYPRALSRSGSLRPWAVKAGRAA